jgi:hypothetical protein
MTEIKDQALAYLQDLDKTLSSSGMPKGPEMNTTIRRITVEAKMDDKKKHLKLPEAAFLNTFVVPQLYEHLQSRGGLDGEQARQALLNEYHRSMPSSSAHSPIHPGRHPFRKILGTAAATVYGQWANPKKGDGLTQSAPDFALREPFPHRIVFEGKYFGSGSADFAQRQLATDLYQAFFYRGLSFVEAKYKGKPDWGYDYACLLAFDASKDGTLLNAWKNLSLKIRRSFWESANIYVMILRD